MFQLSHSLPTPLAITLRAALRSLRRVLAAIALAATALATGCASLPSTEVMQAEVSGFRLPKMPDAGKAMVYVVRPKSYGGLVRFNVFLDDQEDSSEMGFTRAAQYIYFHVSPGDHKLYSKAENWAEIEISAKVGDIIFVRQDPSFGVLFARNSLVKLDELPGTYLVKMLSIGTIHKTDK